MRSSSTSLIALNASLEEALGRLWIPQLKLGSPELLSQMVKGTTKLANGLSAVQGQRNSTIKIASRFLKGETLDTIEQDQLAFVLCEVIPELDGLSIIGSDRLPFLIKHFSDEAKAGELWGPIWRALLISYFNFNPDVADTEDEKEGWESLGKLIRNTWPDIDKRASTKFIPSWLSAIREEPTILGERPAMKFAADFLAGRTEVISHLTEELAIPSSSWFWHALVHETTTHAISQSDDQFKSFIPTLLELIEEKRFYRDVSLAAILERYFRCKDNTCHEDLKDYSIQSWKNPNAFEEGLSPGWNHVAKPVWEMVCSWVNENNLRDFFEILARRATRVRKSNSGTMARDNGADVSRLNFWSQYIKQIRQTRFVFCDVTIRDKTKDKQLEKLISREEGRYARYSNNHGEDAFMMQLGSYLVVEFSNQPNACYVYDLRRLPFEKNSKWFTGTADDLKFGFYGEKAARFTHGSGWETGAYNDLQRLGIYPDPKRPLSSKESKVSAPRNPVTKPWKAAVQKESSSTQSTDSIAESLSPIGSVKSTRSIEPAPKKTALPPSPPHRELDLTQAPKDAPFTMQELQDFAAKNPFIKIMDERSPSGGRIWIRDRSHQERIMRQLHDWDFEWSEKRESWYYNAK